MACGAGYQPRMAIPPRECPGERSWQRLFSSPSGEVPCRVPCRVQRWMEGAHASNARCSSFPCHMHAPGMTERENIRGEDSAAAGLPTTKTAAPHKQQGPGGPTELVAGNRTTPDNPLRTRAYIKGAAAERTVRCPTRSKQSPS